MILGMVIRLGVASASRSLTLEKWFALLLGFTVLWYVPGGVETSSQTAGSARPSAVEQRVPAVARLMISRALGADDPAYRAWETQGAVRMRASGGVSAAFKTGGVMLAGTSGSVWLGLTAIGSRDRLAAVAPVAPEVRANRVTFVHNGVIEWWANGPLGLEQGFTVSHDTASRSSGALTLELGLAGSLRPKLQQSGRAVALVDARGQTALRYGGLSATDARGRVLRSWLRVRRNRLLIRIVTGRAEFPITVDPLVQAAKLTPSDSYPNDMGRAVAISGRTIVAGAPGRSHIGPEDPGAVYVFTEPGSGWANATETAKLTATDAVPGDGLGSNVAVSGGTIVAYAAKNINGHFDQGAVYVFTMPPGGWHDETQTAKLTASDGAGYDDLGEGLAIDDNTIVAGTSRAKIDNNFDQGAVYVFTMPPGGWHDETQTAKLTASDGAAYDDLGYRVAISGSTIVASADTAKVAGYPEAGAVYVFAEPPGGWRNATQTAKLTAAQPANGDVLGYSVAISGPTIVGASGNRTAGTSALYVYTRPSRGWRNATQNATLTASDVAPGDGPGASVAISGQTIVAGDPMATTRGRNQHQGAVYVFREPPGGWRNDTENQKLTASDASTNDMFGTAVGIDGQTVVAGAREYEGSLENPCCRGADYVFVEHAGRVPHLTRLRESARRWQERRHTGRNSLTVGTSLGFTLNTPAKVTFTFSRELPGRLVRGRCRAPNGRNRNARTCVRSIVQGTLDVSGRAGANHVQFAGRLSQTQRLGPGTYRVAITATNVDGEASTSQQLAFTIVA